MFTKKHRQLSQAKRALSLIELAVAAGLTAVMGGLLVANLRQPGSSGSVNGLADTIAAELRQARLQAINSQMPVAICFPGSTTAGVSPAATGFYQLEGWSAPVKTRSTNYSGDFPGTAVVNGIWSVDTGSFRFPGAPSNVANPAVPGQKWRNFNLDQWLPTASKSDYCFVFGPDGSCRTNDLPAYDNAYHLLVANGVYQVGSGATPAGASLPTHPAYFTPQKLGKTASVTIDIAGNIESQGGVPSMATGAIQFVNGAPPALSKSNLTPPGTPGTPTISVLQVETLPKSPALAPGTDVSVSPTGYVTLKTEIVDTANSGVQLYCNWTATPVGSIVRGPSAYSIPVTSGRGVAFTWDPSGNSGAGSWVSTWQWRPPADGQAGDRYTLTLAVQDGEGHNIPVGIPPKVASVCPPGEVFYQGGYTMALWADMWKMNVDGSGRQRFQVSPFSVANPCPNNEGISDVSADGTRVLFQSDRTDVPAGNQSLLVTDRDGTYSYRVSEATVPVSPLEGGSLSPFGGLVAYRRIYGGTTQLCVVNTAYNAADRRTVVLDDLGPKGGAFLQSDPVQVMMGSDQPCFDRKVDNSARLNTIYYVKNLSPTDPRKLAYKIKVAVDAIGRPEVAQPAPQAMTDLNTYLNSNGLGVRAFRHFVAQKPSMAPIDRLYFTTDAFDGSGSKTCYIDLSAAPPITVTQAFTPEGSEECPTPFLDGTVIKMLVHSSLFYFPAIGVADRPAIDLFTPVEGSPPVNRLPIAGIRPELGSRQAGRPCYVRKKN